MKKIALLLSIVLLLVGCSSYPSVEGRYELYVPKNKTKTLAPLLVFLHGKGERGDLPEELSYVRNHGPLKYIDSGNELPFIIAAPQLSKNAQYWDAAFVDSVIKDVQSKYKVDESRIYLSGISMGGYGTWYLGMVYPNRFAALAPIAGGDIFPYNINGIGNDITSICKLKNVPIWVAHGELDSVVPASDAKRLVEQLQKCNANVKFTLYEDKGHVAWEELYQSEGLYQWFLKQNPNQ